ncbi:leucine zipper putative tumor suppressor 3 [Chanos chanos]|uniref:Leucine zipper putative tumor suppressor 3 n=1 Tax=Chanos chanos TaxID=29144 RepID=A0A6J2WA99_CHACN|nr:leucine zipper putative tumor suppressor 3-like [Chanos chanos]
MGSVGSGAASHRKITMRSVGTRTTPNGPLGGPPPPSSSGRRRLDDRSYSAERFPVGVSKAKGSSGDDLRYSDESSYHNNDHSHTDADRGTTHNGNRQQVVNGDRLVSNAVFVNGGSRREGQRGGHSLDPCGNNDSVNNAKNGSHQAPSQYKDKGTGKRDNHNPPNILPVSGKLEQTNDGLVRPSAFKPVVPKSFHSMQNLVCSPQTGSGSGAGASQGGAGGTGGSSGGGGGGGGAGGRGGNTGANREQQDPGGGRNGQGSLSDSGRNSLTSLPTYAGSGYGPPPALGPLSASTSHINRLGTAGLDKPDKPGYQNGLSASDSGRSSSGKSSSSYQRLSHLSDAPAPLRPSPSSDDVIQDLEDRLWEREQEVLHMRRNLDQSEAAIVQVFEEKQRVWEREMEELRQNYAGRLQQVTRRAQRAQQALQAQITRLQQDKRRLQDEMAVLLAQREELEKKCLDYRKEQADLLPRLEETKWEVCQKAGEISLLKQQLRDSQGEVTQRAGEMVALRTQLKELSAQLKEREDAVLGLKESFCTKTLELERCEAELQKMLTEVSLLREKLGAFEAEVTGLKQVLGEFSGPSSLAVDSGMSSLPALTDRASKERLILSPLCPPEPLSLPALPAPDALLSLQSDEAKAQQRDAGDLRRQLERLQAELRIERQQRERQALTFAQERQTWQGEKERVLKYQAQLQLSYVEMLQKNQALEQRVDQLGAKLVGPSPTSPPPPLQPPSQAPGMALPVLALPSPAASLSPPPPPPPPATTEEENLPSLHQLVPPWPVPTRLERIESTEI